MRLAAQPTSLIKLALTAAPMAAPIIGTMVNALRLVAQGGTAVHPDMTSYLVAGLRQLKKDETEEKEHLTPREKEVLQLVATGQSNKEIARSLDIGESTVKFHIQSILRKLNLSSRVQAAVYASQQKHLTA